MDRAVRRIRPLAAGEAALARSVFGDGLRLDTVRLVAAPWPLTRAFVPGRGFGREWIVWPERALTADLSACALGVQAVLIHELVHVWQAQQGVGLIWGKLKAGDAPSAYAYAADEGCRWDALNIEQQAMIVEHAFRLSRGRRVPGGPEFYARVSPFGACRPLEPPGA